MRWSNLKSAGGFKCIPSELWSIQYSSELSGSLAVVARFGLVAERESRTLDWLSFSHTLTVAATSSCPERHSMTRLRRFGRRLFAPGCSGAQMPDQDINCVKKKQTSNRNSDSIVYYLLKEHCIHLIYPYLRRSLRAMYEFDVCAAFTSRVQTFERQPHEPPSRHITKTI